MAPSWRNPAAAAPEYFPTLPLLPGRAHAQIDTSGRAWPIVRLTGAG